MQTVPISGYCAPGFEGVRDTFLLNFHMDNDVGAALAITLDGEVVVNLWGGWVDDQRSRPWQSDTLVNVYSTTKGIMALCAHLLADRGLLDLDAPVARYWPEFAEAGKAHMPVRWLLNHRAALIGPTTPLKPGDIYDWEKVCAALAASKPWWEPGTRPVYHVMTFGFLVGELVRRISGMKIGDLLQQEICAPLNADVFIGVPHALHGRCADLIGQVPKFPHAATVSAQTSISNHPQAIWAVAFSHIPDTDSHNSPEWRAAEVPSGNGHATAHGLAVIYGALACGGRWGETTIVHPTSVERMRFQEHGAEFPDPLVRTEAGVTWGLGYNVNTSARAMGPNPRAFGHGGFGGSYAFADPERRLSFAYTPNYIDLNSSSAHNRSMALAKATYTALGKLR